MTRLPALGPHGEGWVALQSVLLVLLIASTTLGAIGDDPARVVLSAIGIVVLAAGLTLGVAGFLRLGRRFTALPRPKAGGELVREGPYRLVRHPMYGGIVIAGVGAGLMTVSPMTLLLAAVALGFFTLKSMREEAWLVERFPDYPAYRASTKRLIPFVY